MSFKRTAEGNIIRIITSKDFALSTDVSVQNSEDALSVLLSKKNKKVTSAESIDGKIHITRQYITCPVCGKRLSAYVNCNLTANSCRSKNIAALCSNQLSFFSEKEIKGISFNQPRKIGDLLKCPHCGGEGILSERMISCTITNDQNQLSISCGLQTASEVMDINWLPNEILSFNDVLCSETITFHLQSGIVSVSLQCGGETLFSVPCMSSKTLGENDPWLQMFANKRIFREIKRSFEKMYGALPFPNKALTIDKLILLTKFVGYRAEFYRDLPLSIYDETTILPGEFENISDRLRYSDSVLSVFSEINIPKAERIKRIILYRPSILLYEKELERLWKIIENIDLFCELLSCNTIFAILAYFNLYTGIDAYLLDVRELNGSIWLKKMLASDYCGDICSLGVEYISANSTLRSELLKYDFMNNYYQNCCYFGGQFYFSVPMLLSSENSEMSVELGYQFVLLITLKEYYTAAKELHNYLDKYSPCNSSKVYVIRKSNQLIATIEISKNHIFQAFCRENTPIRSKPLINAIAAWAKHNAYTIDDTVFWG